MRTSEKAALHDPFSWQYTPVSTQRHMPLREAALLACYHLRLLNWWLFLLLSLSFLGFGGLVWLQLHAGGSQGLSNAIELSRFVMEPGAGLLAGMLASSLIVGDPLLEVVMATRAGLYQVVNWRSGLAFFVLLLCSAAYLAWSLENGISYARQQSPLFLLLVWLSPVLVMGTLGLFGSLATHNAALGMAIATIPLAGAFFLQAKLLPIQATHPFIIPYTYWGEQDARDWWTNRLALLGIALALAIWNWWLLRREERLLGNFH
ncbi:hypothetical protein [Ktedonobacter racemifer]|uniref:Uncharacterized protein n=1 Tax=Ktedonobacter racemifer DSM 44963 TaxID=485913 RepID=D6TR12_KTERA|nr:hypothetical protein [Ktedonobacter racemifer]EFH85883.1 hypothetical protein Krac_7138 [Ktedonobacter racemifer DSM 44963]